MAYIVYCALPKNSTPRRTRHRNVLAKDPKATVHQSRRDPANLTIPGLPVRIGVDVCHLLQLYAFFIYMVHHGTNDPELFINATQYESPGFFDILQLHT